MEAALNEVTGVTDFTSPTHSCPNRTAAVEHLVARQKGAV